MTISKIKDLLSEEVLANGDLSQDVSSACGSDMMSDVLAYVKDQAVLLTGLVNTQVVRTAEMMDMICIVFVRNKRPTGAMIDLAMEHGVVTPRRRAVSAMSEPLRFHYDVNGKDFTSAGKASVDVKKNLRLLGLSPEIVRRVSIAMYEGEINMVIHAGGGVADVSVDEGGITIILEDHGPGIEDISLAMQEGYSTAPDNIRQLGFGAGMGLPNMKRYTDEMDIESVVGSGTKITMRVNIS